MPYRFAGFLARPAVARPAALPGGVIWREITAPFVGVRLPASDIYEESLAPDDVHALTRSLGIIAAERWLFLDYLCWGGSLEFVYGLGSGDGRPVGPVEVSDIDEVEHAYVRLMAHIGVSEADALFFEPFTRGYWDE